MSETDKPILIIDDEEIVLLAITESLQTEGYQIIKTTDPRYAIELLKEHEFSVIISDHHMPGMTGLEFFAEANKLQPFASRILITGVLTLKVVVDAINKGEIFRFIAKPWIREELLATVKNAINRHELIAQHSALQQETQAINTQLKAENDSLRKELESLRSNKNPEAKTKGQYTKALENALDLCARLLHQFHPQLGRETTTTVKLAKALASSSYLSEADADTLVLAAYFIALGRIHIDEQKWEDFLHHPFDQKTEDLEYLHNVPIYAQLQATTLEGFDAVHKTIRAIYEKWDGTGYPDALKGEQIPVPARYLMIIVAYVQSLRTTRETIDYIKSQKGYAFHPESTEQFLETCTSLSHAKKTREIMISQLQPGMVIYEDLKYPSGATLMPRGSTLNAATIQILQSSEFIENSKPALLILS